MLLIVLNSLTHQAEVERSDALDCQQMSFGADGHFVPFVAQCLKTFTQSKRKMYHVTGSEDGVA